MSNDGVEAGLSVPRPTRIPAARSSASGAIPQPSSAFERGQCATATSCSASRAISSASTVTQCAATTDGPSAPARASARIPVSPSGGGKKFEKLASGPLPWTSHSSSAGLSARCVAIGRPVATQAR